MSACSWLLVLVLLNPGGLSPGGLSPIMTAHGMRNRCDACGAEGVKVFRCSRCFAVRYCGLVCQRRAWMQHREVCDRWADFAEELGAHPAGGAQPAGGTQPLGWALTDRERDIFIRFRELYLQNPDESLFRATAGNIDATLDMLRVLQYNRHRNRDPLVFAIHCNQGRHRSPALAQLLFDHAYIALHSELESAGAQPQGEQSEGAQPDQAQHDRAQPTGAQPQGEQSEGLQLTWEEPVEGDYAALCACVQDFEEGYE